MRPDEEDAIWGESKRKTDRYKPGTPTDQVLANRFPELVTAGGGIDPREAIISLLDKIEELERRVENAGD